MQRTPLHQWHVSRKAKMTEFAGWEMPLYYSSILDEHSAVRNAAGLFDVCHMGRLWIHGPEDTPLLSYAFTNHVASMKIDQARYGLICSPSGGAIDDVIVYRRPAGFLVITNGINKDAVLEHLKEILDKRGWRAEAEDDPEISGMVAIQGPASVGILQKIASAPLDEIRKFRLQSMKVGEIKCLVARTGYTGEDGFELIPDAGQTVEIWEALLEAGENEGLRPTGLGARDSLRIEAGMPLYGNELRADVNPLFAGVEPYIKFAKPDFCGKHAMLHWTIDNSTRYLVAFEMLERAVPRTGCLIESGRDTIGEVSSGVFSPTLRKGIGMGFVELPYRHPGSEIAVRIGRKEFPARVVERPLYKRKVN